MATGSLLTESTPLLGPHGARDEISPEPQGLHLPTASPRPSDCSSHRVRLPTADSDCSPEPKKRYSARGASETGWAAKRPGEKKGWQAWGLERLKKGSRSMAQVSENYSLGKPHCRMDTNEDGIRVLADYDVQKMTTMRVFFVATGTVLESPILWIETAVIAAIYWAVFVLLMYVRWDGFSEFVGSDTDVRAFISMFSTLIGLLLSFYTSLNISRWWSLRTTGVEGISQGASKLIILLSQGVTRDSEILDAVRRYAVGSLMLVFHKDQEDVKQLDHLVEQQLLTQNEADQLGKAGDSRCYPEALWVWLAHIVNQCNQAGLCKGPPHYCALLAAVDEGRSGAATMKTYMETPIPMGYVHLLGLMVKLHNVILALLMALVSVKHAGHQNTVAIFRAMFRCFFMPFLYNAILVINDELTDPFGTDVSDFPAHLLYQSLSDDVTSFINMGNNLPEWIENLDLKKEGA